jgi:hypothetical protein
MCTVFARHTITVRDPGGDHPMRMNSPLRAGPACGTVLFDARPTASGPRGGGGGGYVRAVAALDLALESLAYSDALSAPSADRLGIGGHCVGDLQEQIVDALGSTPALELRRLSALLSVVSSLERIALNCAAIADLVPDLASALDDDRATRRTVELAGVDTRARLVGARDVLQTWSSSWTGTTPSGWTPGHRATGGLRALAAVAGRLPHGSSMAAALPLLVDHLVIDDRGIKPARLRPPVALGDAPVSAGSRRPARHPGSGSWRPRPAPCGRVRAHRGAKSGAAPRGGHRDHAAPLALTAKLASGPGVHQKR